MKNIKRIAILLTTLCFGSMAWAQTGTAISASKTISASGDYYVSANFTGKITVNSGVTATVDLNGKTITWSSSSGVNYVIENNGTLTIVDNVGGAILKGPGTTADDTKNIAGMGIRNNGVCYFEGGTIKDFRSRKPGAAVWINNNRKLYMRGGRIENCMMVTATDADDKSYEGGAAVYNHGEFYMEGGTIYNCRSHVRNTTTAHHTGGGAICNLEGATFVMSGGLIDACFASTVTGYEITSANEKCRGGGGVLNLGSFTMTGGTIRNCYVADRIRYGSGGGVLNTGDGEFIMSGGLITGCSLKKDNQYGAGVASMAAYYSSGWHYENAYFSMTGGEISNNTSLYSGGGLCLSFGNATLSGGKITNNTAATMGGGIVVGNKGALTLEGTIEISYNTTTDGGSDDGGAGIGIGAATGANTVTMNGGSIVYNTSYSIGGGVMLRESTTSDCYAQLTLNGGVIANNSAGTNGGGIALGIASGTSVSAGQLTINGGTVSDNTATGLGGGVFLDAKKSSFTTTIVGGTIANNSGTIGGGVWSSGTLNYSGGTISGNSATNGRGGGIFMSEYKSDGTTDASPCLNMTGGSVIGNYAKVNGGGIFIKKGANNVINGSSILIDGNHAEGSGGGVAIGTVTVPISGATISNNKAGNNGGGIYVNSTVNVSDVTIAGNSSSIGGGIYDNGNVNLSGSIHITGNFASNLGGGVYGKGNLYLGDGSYWICNNKAGNVDDDVYLPSGKVITSTSTTAGSFLPYAIGITTVDTPSKADVAVIYNANGSTVLDPVKTGLDNGTFQIYDNRHLYATKYYSDGTNTQKKNIYFVVATSPWSPLQQTVTPSDYVPNDINSVKRLTAFLWKVNGLEGFTADPAATGTLTADIDMTGHYWTPIGTATSAYTGTLEGNGHAISHISMNTDTWTNSYNSGNLYGLFGAVGTNGKVQNLVVNDFDAATGANAVAVGPVVAQLNGGDVINCYAESILAANVSTCKIGGLVGEATSGSNIKNNFSYPKFSITNNGYAGGIAGSNAGTMENCYVRDLQTGSTTGSNFGWLVGNNTGGSVQYGYIPADESTYVSTGATPSNSNTFTSSKIFSYDIESDNRVGDDRMFTVLNRYVGSANSSLGLMKWERPTTDKVNGGLPVLKYTGSNAVGSPDEAELYYSYSDANLATMLNSYEAGGIFLYDNADLSEQSITQGAGTFAIHPSASLLQGSNAIRALVSIAMQYTSGTQYYHGVSSSITAWPMGFVYGDNSQVEMYYAPNPCLVSMGRSDGFFPSDINPTGTMTTDSDIPWDFYDFSEPWTHWVNYRRNSLSHWHEDYTTVNLEYTNHATLLRGKGYLAAVNLPIDNDSILLQHEGLLNSGEIGVAVTKSGTEYTMYPGINMIGNPYESYLDFDAFADDNSTLWAGTPFYAAYDKDNGFVYYTQGASENYPNEASRYIHKHQGFLVEVSSAGTVGFDDGMRTNTGRPHFRDWERNYPLVNLIVTDSEGERDVCVVEMNRPDQGGASKLLRMNMCTGDIYARQNDANYSIVFTDGRSNTPIWFEAREEATYTLTWSTRHGEFDYLHLVDNLTGADIDLTTAQEYTFTAKPSDFRSRFKLVCQCTGMEENEVHSEAPFAFVSNGQLVVTGEGALQLIDLNGRVLQQMILNGTQNTVSLPELATGVYILKLNDRTQKIVM